MCTTSRWDFIIEGKTEWGIEKKQWSNASGITFGVAKPDDETGLWNEFRTKPGSRAAGIKWETEAGFVSGFSVTSANFYINREFEKVKSATKRGYS